MYIYICIYTLNSGLQDMGRQYDIGGQVKMWPLSAFRTILQKAIDDIDILIQPAIPLMGSQIDTENSDVQDREDESSILEEERDLISRYIYICICIYILIRKHHTCVCRNRLLSTYIFMCINTFKYMDIMHSFIYIFRESSIGDIDIGTEIRDAIKTSEKEIYKEMNRKAIRFKDTIELELYIKMRSYMLGRGTAVLAKDVPLEILNSGYNLPYNLDTGYLRTSIKRGAIVRLDVCSSLGGLYNDLGAESNQLELVEEIGKRVDVNGDETEEEIKMRLDAKRSAGGGDVKRGDIGIVDSNGKVIEGEGG
jgi:hypothetical protein